MFEFDEKNFQLETPRNNRNDFEVCTPCGLLFMAVLEEKLLQNFKRNQWFDGGSEMKYFVVCKTVENV